MSPSTGRTRASGPRLELGKVTITDAATAALERTGTEGVLLLARHLHGNWGDLCEQDALQNELALLLGLRVLSCYAIADGIRIWIVTEADRKPPPSCCLMAIKGRRAKAQAPGEPRPRSQVTDDK